MGLITLVGLISKHGILMVDFARRLQARGVAFEEAIIGAAAVRLRPILMTTAAIVMAVIPLLIASGPGAVTRQAHEQESALPTHLPRTTSSGTVSIVMSEYTEVERPALQPLAGLGWTVVAKGAGWSMTGKIWNSN